MRIVIFEDSDISKMYPIALTRAGSFISVASLTLTELATLATKDRSRVIQIVRPFIRPQITKMGYEIDLSAHANEPTLWLNACTTPSPKTLEFIKESLARGEEFMTTKGSRVTAAFTKAGFVIEGHDPFDHITRSLLGSSLALTNVDDLGLLDYPHHVIDAHKKLGLTNISFRLSLGGYTRVGKEDLWVAEGVELPSLYVVKTQNGPVLFDKGVSVADFSYFRGPVYLGEQTRVIEHASVKDGVSTGKVCKIGGEVETSIIESYSNKQHHGFLGHAYVGSWVNLGAGTSNSDLKNTYGTIQVQSGGLRMSSGMQFLGCVIGDFSKTAINTSIFTGKIVGVNSNLYGYVGQNVSSFTNYASSFGQITECDINQAINTQKRMFARRKIDQTPEDVQLIRDVFALTADERKMSTDPLVL